MRHFDAPALQACLPWPALVQALREMLIQGGEAPLRHTHALGDEGSMLLMPAWQTGKYFGIKTVAIFPGNSARQLPAVNGTYALFDACTGVPLASMDGSELTARRTAATSALAASFLAREDACHLLIIGAGRVGSLMAPALRAVRPGLQRISVFNRHAAGALVLAETLCAQGFDAAVTTDLPDAVRKADIVSCATLATAPLVLGEWLRAGTHLNLVGSFTPQMREADAACLVRGRVYVDNEEAMSKAGDIVQAVDEGLFNARQMAGTLQALCRGQASGRVSSAQITVFKSVGNALQDLAAAGLAMRASTQTDNA